MKCSVVEYDDDDFRIASRVGNERESYSTCERKCTSSELDFPVKILGISQQSNLGSRK